MATRVILVRHGQSSFNAQQMIQGRCNDSLITEKGEKQAHLLAIALQNVHFTGFYSSPLQRAYKTAEIIQSLNEYQPSITVSEKLQEIDLPLWEKKKKKRLKENIPKNIGFGKKSQISLK